MLLYRIIKIVASRQTGDETLPNVRGSLANSLWRKGNFRQKFDVVSPLGGFFAPKKMTDGNTGGDKKVNQRHLQHIP